MKWIGYKYFLLTVALTGFLLLVPILNLTFEIDLLEEIIFLSLMLITLKALSHNKSLFNAGLALSAITLLSTLLSKSLNPDLFYLGFCSAFILLFIVFWVIVHDIMTSKDIVTDTIFGAIAAYLLAGVCWAILYAIIDIVIPGSIMINIDQPEQFTDTYANSLLDLYNYFSFTTMTTLGYGDIVPVHPITRALATYQAMFGQMFIAILVARLVSLQLTKNT